MNFFETAATPACLQALDEMRRHHFLADFYLAGGTALALQIGHRISTDLDWFSTTHSLLTPEREALTQTLGAIGQFEVISEQEGMRYGGTAKRRPVG